MGLSVTEVQKALKGADYPASRDQLVQKAKTNGAGDDIVEALRGVGEDSFGGPNEVMKAMKGDLGD
jgi:hypothetical protein